MIIYLNVAYLNADLCSPGESEFFQQPPEASKTSVFWARQIFACKPILSPNSNPNLNNFWLEIQIEIKKK